MDKYLTSEKLVNEVNTAVRSHALGCLDTWKWRLYDYRSSTTVDLFVTATGCKGDQPKPATTDKNDEKTLFNRNMALLENCNFGSVAVKEYKLCCDANDGKNHLHYNYARYRKTLGGLWGPIMEVQLIAANDDIPFIYTRGIDLS